MKLPRIDELVAALDTAFEADVAACPAITLRSGDAIDSYGAGLPYDPRLDVAYWAVMLLGRFGGMSVPAQTQIVSALTAALESHAEIAVRQQAAWALGKFGVAANSARESLSQAAACGDPRLARLAKEAIGNLK